MANHYFSGGQGHSKHLFLYIYGGCNHFSDFWPLKYLKITYSSNKTNLYAFLENIFVCVTNTSSAGLSNILYQSRRTEFSIFDKDVSIFCLGSSIFTIPKNYRNYTIEQGRVLVYALSLQHRLRIILLFVVCEVRWCHNEVGLHKYYMHSMRSS